MKNQNKNIKKCIICGRDFECYSRPKVGRRGGAKRVFRAITCSKKCSIEYREIRQTKEMINLRKTKTKHLNSK
jgi:hypothetical protein